VTFDLLQKGMVDDTEAAAFSFDWAAQTFTKFAKLGYIIRLHDLVVRKRISILRWVASSGTVSCVE
jgi:hypothetical protein